MGNFFRRISALFYRLIFCIMYIFAANSLFLIIKRWYLIFPVLAILFIANLLPGFTDMKITNGRLSICNHGAECLLIFLVTLCVSVIIQAGVGYHFSLNAKQIIFNALFCILSLSVIFWNGIISVYCSSLQLGIIHRILGIVLAWWFPVNLLVLGNILRIVFREQRVETEKVLLNSKRKDKEICKTKYPILLVHGFFFRDNKHLNYWGRIPEQLLANGATIYYGEHSSALCVEDSAEELRERIEKIVAATGAEKFNIIAHSKGGLDCRYAIKHLGIGEHVASLTTVNTPNRGCGYADILLEKIPNFIQRIFARTYNTAAHKLGDPAPDFLAGARSLTESACAERFDPEEIPEGIYCQSVGSVLRRARHGKFPTNISSIIVKHYNGPNDGLVPTTSFEWGEKYTLVRTNRSRGVSHADIIDLNRTNLRGFDVREFYVQLVADLKNRGL